MLFGIHIRKYYKKYAILFILGILFLIFVDWIQLYIPEFTGKIVDLVNAGVDEESKKTILEYCLWILLIAFGMFVGRMTWR